jgi:hypothetical protein
MLKDRGDKEDHDKGGPYSAAHELIEVESRTAETRDLKPNDTILRKYGFAIYSRPKGKEPTWIKNGKLYDEGCALEICEQIMAKNPVNKSDVQKKAKDEG